MYCDNWLMIIDKKKTIKEENRMTEVKKNTFNIMFNANGTFNNNLLTTIPNAVKKILPTVIFTLYSNVMILYPDTLEQEIFLRNIFQYFVLTNNNH